MGILAASSINYCFLFLYKSITGYAAVVQTDSGFTLLHVCYCLSIYVLFCYLYLHFSHAMGLVWLLRFR